MALDQQQVADIITILSPWLVSVVLPLFFLSAVTREHVVAAGSWKKWRDSGGLRDIGLEMGVTGFMMQIGTLVKTPTVTLFFSLLFLIFFTFVPLYYFHKKDERPCVVSGFVLLVLGFAWVAIWLA